MDMKLTWITLKVLIVMFICVVVKAGPLVKSNRFINEAECSIDEECIYEDDWLGEYQKCINGYCQCEPGENGERMCLHRTISDSWFHYDYYCGICGDMGSECSDFSSCPEVASCIGNFCSCNANGATITMGICRVDVLLGGVNLITIGMIILLIGILLLNKAISSTRLRRRIRRRWRRCMRRRRRGRVGSTESFIGDDGVYFNPRSTSKTPSSTLTNTDFMSTSEDPDLDWAIELSMQEFARIRQLADERQRTAQDGSSVADSCTSEDSSGVSSTIHENVEAIRLSSLSNIDRSHGDDRVKTDDTSTTGSGTAAVDDTETGITRDDQTHPSTASGKNILRSISEGDGGVLPTTEGQTDAVSSQRRIRLVFRNRTPSVDNDNTLVNNNNV